MRLKFASLFLVGVAWAWPQAATIPDTPAGHVLQAWLDAFNSGDRARIQAYLAKWDPARPLENMVNFRQQTGGFDLAGIDKSERLTIQFRVKEKNRGIDAVGTFTLKDTD